MTSAAAKKNILNSAPLISILEILEILLVTRGAVGRGEYINFPYHYRLMAIWVQNVENMGFGPEHPVLGCCSHTIGNFSW